MIERGEASAFDEELRAAVESGELPEWLETVMCAAERLPLPEVPPAVSQELRRMMDPPTLAEHHELELVHDSRRERRLVGVRGSESVGGWTLWYASRRADLVVDVLPIGTGRFTLEGQVLMHAIDGPARSARARGPIDVDASTDWLGRFEFGAVPEGQYALRAEEGRVELLADVDLTSAP
jgi:hypothetical protein